MCPPGFTYLTSAGSCYKVIFERDDWYSAGRKCQRLRHGSHLAAITSAAENSAIKTFLASKLSSMCKYEYEYPVIFIVLCVRELPYLSVIFACIWPTYKSVHMPESYHDTLSFKSN